MKILVLNAGSSSQKYALFEIAQRPELTKDIVPIWTATAEKDPTGLKVRLNARTRTQSLDTTFVSEPRSQAIRYVVDTLVSGKTKVIDNFNELRVIGHRIVHGGGHYNRPVRVDSTVKAHIKALSVLAPQHNPIQLEGIRVMEKLTDQASQIAVFDTAFHRTLPEYAQTYPIPFKWYEQGIRRFGFHGISHENCSQRAARIIGIPIEDLNIISCHLGNGVSIAAIQGGICIDTSMGFSPLEGVMMGSRSGSIDPAIIIHLLKHFEMDFEEVSEMLERKSGLLGVSGISSDMRVIHASIERGNKRARLALDIYIHRLCSAIGAMVATLGKVDIIVFTAGIGENDPVVRGRICERLGYVNLYLDSEKNKCSLKEQDISKPDSDVRILVLPARENWAIAQKCWKTMNNE